MIAFRTQHLQIMRPLILLSRRIGGLPILSLGLMLS
ncbi:Uncharacterised protein [Vibrio cholerae]|nr:Uncharacterised protein [Vibrio cholerae]CSI63506.1 Uncharacterised protein [Vibrio cholerae]